MATSISVRAYRSASGRSPVLEWLIELSELQFDHCQILIESLTLQGHRLGMPASRALGDGLYELRDEADGVQLRMLYSFQRGAIAVVAAGFVKKGPHDLDRVRPTAERRRREADRDPDTYTLEITLEVLEDLRKRRKRK